MLRKRGRSFERIPAGGRLIRATILLDMKWTINWKKTAPLCLLVNVCLAAASNEDHRVLVSKDRNGVALQGYDAVAYFDGGKPQKGSKQFHAAFDGATYLFATPHMQDQKLLVAYPLLLFYACFALLTIF